MRLEITRRAELAIRALTHLAATGDRLKALALADVLGTTVGFVPQIVGPLVKAGWVRSDPGPTGGYSSRVTPGDVSVLAVIEAIDGLTDTGRCVVADRACGATEPCPLHHAWGRARDELVRILGETSLEASAPGVRS